MAPAHINPESRFGPNEGLVIVLLRNTVPFQAQRLEGSRFAVSQFYRMAATESLSGQAGGSRE
jgi:hypothetical protein